MIFSLNLLFVIVGIFLFFLIFLTKQYKRCPSNRILVIYGKVSGSRAAKCYHGGGALVVPLIQDYSYLSLEPITIDIELNGALSKKNIRVNVPSTFTIGISTQPDIMQNAAERLLSLDEVALSDQARDIILGQLRLVIATLSIEEINQDREKFLELVNNNVGIELNKIGLEVINVNIRDITDESGYIEAIGKRAAAEAINRAKVEVAEQEKEGAIGEAAANKQKEVSVAEQMAESMMGQKKASRDQRIALAKYEAEGISSEAESQREQDVASAAEQAKTIEGRKLAESNQRVQVATLEAKAVEGENQSKAQIADYNAQLHVKEANAMKLGETAKAQAERAVLEAEKLAEIARLEKVELAQKEVDKRKIEVEAEAKAEEIRRIARGEADATLARYQAEADGILKVLNSKAQGYQSLVQACGDDKQLAPTFLMVEQLPELIAEQVKAIQNLKIDKITVWDGASGNGNSSTSSFLRSLIGSLPAMHELAEQAGMELPDILGTLGNKDANRTPLNGSRPQTGSETTQ